jgi:phage baseplate assembly protein W
MSILGLKFPFQKGSTSFPAVSSDENAIRDNILRILQEREGERPMRAGVGSHIWKFIFENTGSILQARIDYEVRRALSRGEPRITVIRVIVTESEDSKGDTIVYVDILYRFNMRDNSITTTFAP